MSQAATMTDRVDLAREASPPGPRRAERSAEAEAPTSTRQPKLETPAPSARNAKPETPEAPKKKPKARIVGLVLALVALGGGGSAYALTRGHETTDDAEVEGHVQTVAARTNGQIVEVRVKDNDTVEAGQVLVVLDKADYEAKVELAKADVAAATASLDAANAQLDLTKRSVDANLKQAQGGLKQASSGLAGSQASVGTAKADVDAAQTKFNLAEKDRERMKALFDTNAISQAQFDVADATLDQARANLEAAQARLNAAQASISANAGGVEFAEGRLSSAQTGPEQLAAANAAVELATARKKQAEASLHLAELALDYTEVKAPVRGVVSKRSAEVGQMASPDRPLMAIVPLDDVWVVANFKETQLENMKPGQPVVVEVDAFGGKKLHGHVDSFASATGAKFSLLPPDNSSGNFVKVVQRVPTLIRFDDEQGLALRPGMSVSVDVTTR